MNETPPGKKIAIISYFTFIGMLIAYYMNRNARYEFATWHIKNMFGLILLLLISQVTQAYISLAFGEVLWVITFVLWLYSIVMALMNSKKAIPFFSRKFQEWFTFLD